MMDGVLLLGDLSALPGQLGTIFYHIVLPMLLIIAIGFTVQRQLGLDMKTMVRLNFYFIVPAIIYYVLVTSELKRRGQLESVGGEIAVGRLIEETPTAANVERYCRLVRDRAVLQRGGAGGLRCRWR